MEGSRRTAGIGEFSREIKGVTLHYFKSPKSKVAFAGIGIFLAASLFAARTFLRPHVPAIFEASPPLVTSGSDPSITVRDTGDIYLLKVEKENLWYERSTMAATRSDTQYG